MTGGREMKKEEKLRVKQRESGGFEAQVLCIFITPLSMQWPWNAQACCEWEKQEGWVCWGNKGAKATIWFL